MLRRIARAAAVSSAATVAAGVVAANGGSVPRDADEARLSLLSLARATRAAGAWVRLVALYKLLDSNRPGSGATPAEAAAFARRREDTHRKGAELVLRLCERNGGLFIKMGQHAASLRPAIPDTYVDTLRVLQDRAPQRDLDAVKKCIGAELPRAMAEEICAGLDPVPVSYTHLTLPTICSV